MSNEKKKSKKFKKTKKKPIRISVLRPVLNLDRGTSCWRVAYTDLERQTRSIDIGSEIFRSPKDVAKMLLSAHAALPDDAKKQENLVKAALSGQLDKCAIVQGTALRSCSDGRHLPRSKRSASKEAKR